MVAQDIDTVGLAGYRVLFTRSSEGVLFCTQDGQITAANPAACALLDMSAEDICALGGTSWSTRRIRAGRSPWQSGSERDRPSAWPDCAVVTDASSRSK